MLKNIKITEFLAIVAAIATIIGAVIAYLQYKDIDNNSEYTFTAKTFEKDKIPKDIYDILTEEFLNKRRNIKNNFEMAHVSGKALKNITIDIQSDSEITDATLNKGEIGSVIDVSKDKKSASIKKDILIPGSILSGIITTSNLSEVKMTAYAENGVQIKAEQINSTQTKTEQKSTSDPIISLIKTLFSLIFALIMPYLLYKSIQYERSKYNYDNNYLYYLYLGSAISSNWGSILANLFFAHTVYFLATREALITAALEGLVNREHP